MHTAEVIIMAVAVLCLLAEGFDVHVGNVRLGWIGLALWSIVVFLGILG